MNTAEKNFDFILSVKDEQIHFFPSVLLPGAMRMFKPLLDAMKACVGNRPIALAEEVEDTLMKAYPSAISDLNLITFAEYVSLGRQRGLPIRCSQSCGKIIYMWFSLVEEETGALFALQSIEAPSEFSELQNTNNSDCFTRHQDYMLEINSNDDRNEGTPEIDFMLDQIRQTFQDSTLASITDSKTYKIDFETSFEVVSSSSKRQQKRDQKSKEIDQKIKAILTAMTRQSYKFYLDPILFKFVAILIKFILLNPDVGSIVSANQVFKFIQRQFPQFLGSPSHSNNMKDKAYSALLSRCNHQEWQMPIVFMRRRYGIDIGKLKRLIATYQHDS